MKSRHQLLDVEVPRGESELQFVLQFPSRFSGAAVRLFNSERPLNWIPRFLATTANRTQEELSRTKETSREQRPPLRAQAAALIDRGPSRGGEKGASVLGEAEGRLKERSGPQVAVKERLEEGGKRRCRPPSWNLPCSPSITHM